MQTRASRPRRSTAPPQPDRSPQTLENPNPYPRSYRCTLMLPSRLHSPTLSLKAPFMALPASLRREATQRQWRKAVLSRTLLPAQMGLRFGPTSAAEKREADFGALEFLPSRIPSFCSGSLLRGLTGALRLGALLLRLRRPAGYGFQSSTDPPHKCRAWHLGARPTRWLCH